MINVAVEGESDRELARAVVNEAGREVAQIVVKGGKTRLDPLLANYNRASRHTPWVVFRDSDTHCPVELHTRLTAALGKLSPSFLLRIVHPMSEGWLLADRAGFAGHFGVRKTQVPSDSAILQNAKQTVLTLCASSRFRTVREEMVLPDGRTGPLYTMWINEFASTAWNIAEASSQNGSLRRAIERIRQLPGASGRTT